MLSLLNCVTLYLVVILKNPGLCRAAHLCFHSKLPNRCGTTSAHFCYFCSDSSECYLGNVWSGFHQKSCTRSSDLGSSVNINNPPNTNVLKRRIAFCMCGFSWDFPDEWVKNSILLIAVKLANNWRCGSRQLSSRDTSELCPFTLTLGII